MLTCTARTWQTGVRVRTPVPTCMPPPLQTLSLSVVVPPIPFMKSQLGHTNKRPSSGRRPLAEKTGDTRHATAGGGQGGHASCRRRKACMRYMPEWSAGSSPVRVRATRAAAPMEQFGQTPASVAANEHTPAWQCARKDPRYGRRPQACAAKPACCPKASQPTGFHARGKAHSSHASRPHDQMKCVQWCTPTRSHQATPHCSAPHRTRRRQHQRSPAKHGSLPPRCVRVLNSPQRWRRPARPPSPEPLLATTTPPPPTHKPPTAK